MNHRFAEVAELADAPGSGPGSLNGSGGSSPLFGTCGRRVYVKQDVNPFSFPAFRGAVVVVLALDYRDGNLRFVVKDVLANFFLPRATSLPRTVTRPFVKKTCSRICASMSHPACWTAGVMNFVHMSSA